MENVLVTGFCGGYLCRMNINELKPDGRNYNKGTDKGRKLVKRSLKELGAGRSVLVDKDGNIIAGNKTVEAAKALGYDNILIVPTDGKTLVAVQRTDVALDSEQGRALALADNATSAAGLAWDFEAMAADGWGEGDLTGWGVEIPEGETVKAEAVEDGFEPPAEIEEIQTGIVLGDLFEIGPHRLMCGDSTIAADVERLMGGEKADMVFTDPPYGVNIQGGENNTNIAGDLTQTAIPFSFELAIKVATKDDARLYFCGGEGNTSLYFKLFERYIAQMPRLLIWDKEHFVMKPNGYHNQFEIIFFGYKKNGGGLSKWFSPRTADNATDVWRIKRDASKHYNHPTQKPVELPHRAIRNSSDFGNIVYEPFSGSGSTMSASHQLDRRCYAMEIDPKYCQVTVDRMRKLDPNIEIKKNGQPFPVTAI